MACLELSDGMSPFLFPQEACISSSPVILVLLSFRSFFLNIGSPKVRQLTHSPYPYSAEAVASMIKAHIIGKSWDPPAWLPKRYLTWATEA